MQLAFVQQRDDAASLLKHFDFNVYAPALVITDRFTSFFDDFAGVVNDSLQAELSCCQILDFNFNFPEITKLWKTGFVNKRNGSKVGFELVEKEDFLTILFILLWFYLRD